MATLDNALLVKSLTSLYNKNKKENFTLNSVTPEQLKSMIGVTISEETYNKIVNEWLRPLLLQRSFIFIKIIKYKSF